MAVVGLVSFLCRHELGAVAARGSGQERLGEGPVSPGDGGGPGGDWERHLVSGYDNWQTIPVNPALFSRPHSKKPFLFNFPGIRQSPLHEAAYLGHTHIMDLLLDAGGKVNAYVKFPGNPKNRVSLLPLQDQLN